MKFILTISLMLFLTSVSFSQSKVTYDSPDWELNAIGTEPFWNLSLDEDDAEFSTIDSRLIKFVTVNQIKVEGEREDFITTFRLSSRSNTAFVTIKKCENSCSDGMSDNKYDYEIVLILNGKKAYYGVGNLVTDND